MVFILVVVLSSTFALPIDIDLEDYNRRNDLGLSYGEMKKAIDEAFQTENRINPLADTSEDDDDDLKHYKDENLDYVLLERLTNDILEENGGNLDRELTDTEYEEISGRYFKRLEGSIWATPTGENTRSEDENNTSIEVNTTPVTRRDEWWTTPSYWWTSPTYWDGTLWGLKTAWQTWKQTTARGTDSRRPNDHTKHFDWTGESKSGHQVHVVVYFEK